MSQLQQIISEYEHKARELRVQFQAEAQREFVKITSGFFEEFPHVLAVRWAQYTPYFNDGEECVFEVQYRSFKFDQETLDQFKDKKFYFDDDDQFLDEEYLIYAEKVGTLTGQRWGGPQKGYETYEYPKYESFPYVDWFEQLQEQMTVLIGFPEDFLKTVFGDHAQVTITREGVITVEAYEHG